MITSVDANVLFDLFRTESPHHSQSLAWLRDAYDRGAIVWSATSYTQSSYRGSASVLRWMPRCRRSTQLYPRSIR